MEKEFDYLFKKAYSYVNTSLLKQKEASNILDVICNGRLAGFIEFEGYGICEYDDDDIQQMNAYVTVSDKFNRFKTNVLVFKIFNNGFTHDAYDKLFIFKTVWTKDTTFNFIMLNTSTGISTHMPEIEFAYDILAQNLTKAFNIIHENEIYNFYNNKYNLFIDGKLNKACREIELKKIIEDFWNAKIDKSKLKDTETTEPTPLVFE